jgi:hypothetical protein
MDLQIFVPTEPGSILKGAAIVGRFLNADEPITVHFEGNAFGADNLQTFEDRLQCAASRLVTRYPTTAKRVFLPDELICVGIASTLESSDTWIVDNILEPELLQAWLGEEPLPAIRGSRELRRRLAGQLYQGLSPSELARVLTEGHAHNR